MSDVAERRSPPTPTARRVGRFELDRVLGRGGQATVWLAHDPRLDREVALKLLNPGADTLAVHQWLHEARAVSRLKHPCIVPVFEADVAADQPYLVFEWVDGGTLADATRARGSWAPRDAVAVMLDVLDALAAAHAQGVVHRDLKPSNVLLGADGRARVMDFGIAARVNPSQAGPADEAGVIIGTPGYMSPEAARGETPAPSMDVFSAGLVLAELLSGRPLVQERDPRRALARVQNEVLALPREVPADDALRSIVARALERAPERRYEGARALHAALADWARPAAGEAAVAAGGHGTLDFLLRRMRHRSDFPAMSEAIMRIQRLSQSDTESLSSLSAEILKDVALTHKLLRLVNSAHFIHARGGAISTVSRAVALIGFAGIRNLALSLVLLEHLHDKAHAAQLQEQFLRSLMAGMLAAELAAVVGEAEEAYIASMLQNLGRLLTDYYFPEEAQRIRQRLLAGVAGAQSGPDPVEAAARQVLGLGFEDLGIGVAKSWGFPEPLLRCMRVPIGEMPNRAAERGVERLRWLGRTANDITDALLLADEAEVQRRCEELAQRCAPVLSVRPRDILGAAETARSAFVRQVQALGLGPAACLAVRRLARGAAAPPANTVAGAAPGAPAPEIDGSRADQPTQRLPRGDAAAAADVLAAGIQDVTNGLVAENLRVDDVLRIVVETVWRAFGLRRVLFCLREGRSEVLTGRFGLGDDAPALLRHFRIPLRLRAGASMDLFTAVCAKGVDTLIADATTAGLAARLPPWYRETVAAPTFLLLPLRYKQSTFGLIYADQDRPGDIALDEREISMLRTLRNQAVMAFRQGEEPH